MKTDRIARPGRGSRYALILWICLLTVLAGACTHGAGKRAWVLNPVLVKNVDPPEAFALIEENRGNPDFVILDVRTPTEFSRGRIEGAVNLNYYSDNFREELSRLDKNKTYVVYCRTGMRSSNVFEMMKEMGFKAVRQISGGIERWLADDLPVIHE
jgi:rhodanese-related sulfurtransferase